MMTLRRRGWMFGLVAGAVVAAGVAAVTGAFPGGEPVRAQIDNGNFWLFQPGSETPVGRVWCNGDRSVEYWVYVNDTYEFAGPTNGPNNRWVLEAQVTTNASYATFNAFQNAMRAIPAFQGHALVFQAHGVVETVVEN